MFCPKCGSKEVVDVFCKDCLREEKPLVKGFKEPNISFCTECHAVKNKGTWTNFTDDLKKVTLYVEELLKKEVMFNNWANIKDIIVELDSEINDKTGLLQKKTAKIIVSGTSSNSKKAKVHDEEYNFPAEVQNTLCPKCKKKGTQFFTGTLQLRNPTLEAINFVRDFFEKSIHHINKESKQKNGGIDFLITNNMETEKVALELQREFGGEVKINTKLFSRNKQTSKDIFRLNALVKLPDFEVGDVIENYNKQKKREELLIVVELAKQIKFFDILRGKYCQHLFKDLVDYKKLKVWVSQVTKIHPYIEVLHPTTYQPVKVHNNKFLKDYGLGEEVDIVMFNNKTYLV